MSQVVSAEIGARLILEKAAPPGLVVTGPIDLRGSGVTALPEGLQAPHLDLSDCQQLSRLPPGLRIQSLCLARCLSLEVLPDDLTCQHLDLSETLLDQLPARLQCSLSLNLTGCSQLRHLPTGLRTSRLCLTRCRNLRALPEGLQVQFLDVQDCVWLQDWPTSARVQAGWVQARGCLRLGMPAGLAGTRLLWLNIRDCSALTRLPDNLVLLQWLELAGSKLKSLPSAASQVELRWKGVTIEPRLAFQPESISAQEVLATENVALRRVKLERVGYERFLAEAQAKVLDRDQDAGGDRQLLKVKMPDDRDEDLVCVAVHCPSTGHKYILRVPPTVRTCRQAIAWTAGYDDPDDYQPTIET